MFLKNGRCYVFEIKNAHEKRTVLESALLDFKKRWKNAPKHQRSIRSVAVFLIHQTTRESGRAPALSNLVGPAFLEILRENPVGALFLNQENGGVNSGPFFQGTFFETRGIPVGEILKAAPLGNLFFQGESWHCF